MLELYTTLGRSEFEENELIVEENIDGMDIVAGVIFADSETGSGTDVTLRLGYYLPGDWSSLHKHTVAFQPLCLKGKLQFNIALGALQHSLALTWAALPVSCTCEARLPGMAWCSELCGQHVPE